MKYLYIYYLNLTCKLNHICFIYGKKYNATNVLRFSHPPSDATVFTPCLDAITTLKLVMSS